MEEVLLAKITEALRIWKEGDSQMALQLLSDPNLTAHIEAQFLVGEIHYNNQNWGAALNSFRKCLQIDPNMRSAQTYVDLISNILGFFHTDQFNP